MKKNLFILTLILIGCILVLLAVRWIIWLKSPQSTEIKFEPQKVSEFSIKSKVVDVSFYKEGEDWKIKDNAINRVFAAEKDIVMRTLESILKLKVYEVVSTNKERQQEFEVNESSGATVEIKLHGKKISFIMGKTSYDHYHNYLRFTDSDQIRLSGGLMRHQVERNRDFWRPSRILQVKREGITRLEINYLSNKKEDLILTLQPGTSEHWLAENVTSGGKPKRADFVSTVKPLLYTICDFIHDGIMPLDQKWGQTLFIVRVTAEEGKFNVLVGDKLVKDKMTYYLVKREDEDTIYRIRDFKMFNVRQKKSDLKILPKPPFLQ